MAKGEAGLAGLARTTPHGLDTEVRTRVSGRKSVTTTTERYQQTKAIFEELMGESDYSYSEDSEPDVEEDHSSCQTRQDMTQEDDDMNGRRHFPNASAASSGFSHSIAGQNLADPDGPFDAMWI